MWLTTRRGQQTEITDRGRDTWARASRGRTRRASSAEYMVKGGGLMSAHGG